MLKELELKQNEKKRLLAELESYKECDPEVMEQMKRDVVVCKDSANRWTGKFLLHLFTSASGNYLLHCSGHCLCPEHKKNN